MEHLSISPEITVAEALGTSYALAPVFVGHKTLCVGCPVARFCTLREVAATYRIALEPFLAELELGATAYPNHNTGARHEASL